MHHVSEDADGTICVANDAGYGMCGKPGEPGQGLVPLPEQVVYTGRRSSGVLGVPAASADPAAASLRNAGFLAGGAGLALAMRRYIPTQALVRAGAAVGTKLLVGVGAVAAAASGLGGPALTGLAGMVGVALAGPVGGALLAAGVTAAYDYFTTGEVSAGKIVVALVAGAVGGAIPALLGTYGGTATAAQIAAANTMWNVSTGAATAALMHGAFGRGSSP
jgi:hypothetical protein